MAADWDQIKAEYMAGGTTYRELSEKYGVSQNVMMKRAAKEKWKDGKVRISRKAAEKIEEKISAKVAEKAIDDLEIARYTAKIWQDTLQQVAALMGTEDYIGLLAKRPDKAAHMSEAIRTNIESLTKACRMLSMNEQRKLELEERRLKLEEEKFKAQQTADAEGGSAVRIVFADDVEEYSE